ncbi:hypothetical protein AYI68_g605 [Smittium mucronatum]|uniref:Uncharacterized protein n=1 Tax=Smittium mucronatum TaxID=133383 RepID=A0A1R0H7M2_9FUNG|nr:hypothetical protein AYI68_g605 [Smittium mucronatum]
MPFRSNILTPLLTLKSGAYPYGFVQEVDAWREVAEDRDSEASASVSTDALELSDDLDPSFSSGPNPPVRFSPIIPTVGAVQTLSVVSTGSNGRSADRWSNVVIPALNSLMSEGEEDDSNSTLGVSSPLAVQQQFRSEDLYQSNWYRESASDSMFFSLIFVPLSFFSDF